MVKTLIVQHVSTAAQFNVDLYACHSILGRAGLTRPSTAQSDRDMQHPPAQADCQGSATPQKRCPGACSQSCVVMHMHQMCPMPARVPVQVTAQLSVLQAQL